MAQFISIHYVCVWRRHLAFFVRFDLCLKCFLIRAERKKINKLRFSPDTLQVDAQLPSVTQYTDFSTEILG